MNPGDKTHSSVAFVSVTGIMTNKYVDLTNGYFFRDTVQ